MLRGCWRISTLVNNGVVNSRVQMRQYCEVKAATGITGFPVIPNAREVLIAQYNKILNDLKAIPASAAYRQDTEALVRYRLGVVEKNTSIAAIESEINCGQVEELIDQNEDELLVIPAMIERKPWNDPIENVPIILRK